MGFSIFSGKWCLGRPGGHITGLLWLPLGLTSERGRPAPRSREGDPRCPPPHGPEGGTLQSTPQPWSRMGKTFKFRISLRESEKPLEGACVSAGMKAFGTQPWSLTVFLQRKLFFCFALVFLFCLILLFLCGIFVFVFVFLFKFNNEHVACTCSV